MFNLVTDLIQNSVDKPCIGFTDPVSNALKDLKIFNYERIYKNPAIKKHLSSIEDIFAHLFETYLTALDKGDESSPIFQDFLKGLPASYRDRHSHAQMARDYISGMTDSFLIRQAPERMRPSAVEYV